MFNMQRMGLRQMQMCCIAKEGDAKYIQYQYTDDDEENKNKEDDYFRCEYEEEESRFQCEYHLTVHACEVQEHRCGDHKKGTGVAA